MHGAVSIENFNPAHDAAQNEGPKEGRMAGVTNLDIDLLRAFAMIAELGSFTRAAERLNRTQSTISLYVKRLESTLGQSLLRRNAHGVQLTSEGELLLTHAREMLRINDEVVARVREPEVSGVVRLGTPEDFATTHLPGVLAQFAQTYPRVRLEVTCDLTLNLLDRFRQGQFDAVLLKREPQGAAEGIRVWREPLVWAAADGSVVPKDGEVPLVVSPHPCVYRKRALKALEADGRRPRVIYTSTSLAGTQAAVRAGLGMTVLPKEMVPAGLQVLGEPEGLPELADTEIALCTAPGDLGHAPRRLAEYIVRALEAGGHGHGGFDIDRAAAA
jgi:DNA-binding transcriptional LysR family regulator